tara:strand:- start:1501 stop:1737 length:237 start_codon:yes stop_codon:yes gene_type:complete
MSNYCDNCGNYDEPYEGQPSIDGDYQPELYYYWDYPMEEDYDWRDSLPEADCLCEICFDILNSEKKIKWKCASTQTGT